MTKFIGRKSELSILADAFSSNKPELIVVYGRRRVGKTFLIRTAYKNNIVFEMSGLHKTSLKKQLNNFHRIINEQKPTFQVPSDWFEAFHQLGQFINKKRSRKKKIIFIDEFPWFATRKSNFLAAFDNFWNNYATKRDDLVVVICGSAASYMVRNIIKGKGGLHNRLTEKIRLKPFNLFETEQLLKSNKIKLTQYDILQLYMSIGGIPHYLEKIKQGESVAQVIDRLCFTKDGFLRHEYKNIFTSLFEQHEKHEAIIKYLASVRKGLTRNEILTKSKIKSGGTLTNVLEELIESGFIEQYQPYKGTKDSLFRLIDEYSMFYIKYIEKSIPSSSDVWIHMYNQSSYRIWSGFSFETICLKHIDQIKEGLKIMGIKSTYGSWLEKKSDSNAQIDLLIDRDDNVINLCEMKFYNTEFTITKSYTKDILRKVNSFKENTQTKKTIFVTFITTYGLVNNEYSKQCVTNELTMNHLFIDL